MARYGVRHFQAVDNIISHDYFRSLLPILKERALGVTFFYEIKSNLRRDQVQLLREAGVLAVQPGIESLSTHVLALMKKGVTGIQNMALLKWCREYGIEAAWNLLYGFPGETGEDYDYLGALCLGHSASAPARSGGADSPGPLQPELQRRRRISASSTSVRSRCTNTSIRCRRRASRTWRTSSSIDSRTGGIPRSTRRGSRAGADVEGEQDRFSLQAIRRRDRRDDDRGHAARTPSDAVSVQGTAARTLRILRGDSQPRGDHWNSQPHAWATRRNSKLRWTLSCGRWKIGN